MKRVGSSYGTERKDERRQVLSDGRTPFDGKKSFELTVQIDKIKKLLGLPILETSTVFMLCAKPFGQFLATNCPLMKSSKWFLSYL
ncbi:hypothetical protein AVEN_229490-1 [Araneus ventricosus]|uniref:Uncharacterized protein n=1 Tax=Araneus ventricosus TaxID=182803 RepID=A0A4Y2TPH2_ARAVE|nr:hypothetical protein AVEN_229490-1 [Araneus ventricosus]